jgi:hypothetical protein
MKQITFTAGLLLASLIASAAQQTPAPTNEPAHNVFVLAGCLEGATATSPFKLTNSTAVGQAPPPTASRSSAAVAVSNADGVYELQAISGITEQGISREQLQSHVGKRVEVTVRPVEVSPATSATSTDTAAKPKEPTPQRYTVIKINRLADSCA